MSHVNVCTRTLFFFAQCVSNNSSSNLLAKKHSDDIFNHIHPICHISTIHGHVKKNRNKKMLNLKKNKKIPKEAETENKRKNAE